MVRSASARGGGDLDGYVHGEFMLEYCEVEGSLDEEWVHSGAFAKQFGNEPMKGIFDRKVLDRVWNEGSLSTKKWQTRHALHSPDDVENAAAGNEDNEQVCLLYAYHINAISFRTYHRLMTFSL